MRSLRSKGSYGKTAMTLTFSGFKIPLLHALLTTGLGQECCEGAFPWSCPVASHVSSKAVARSLQRADPGAVNCLLSSMIAHVFMIARSESGEEALTSASLQ